MKTSIEILKQIIELTQQGLSHEKVAKQLHIAKNTVIKYLREHKIINPYYNRSVDITDELLLEILKYYDNVLNVKKVAKHFHISTTRLRKYIKFKNLKKCKPIKITAKDTCLKNKKLLVEYKGNKCEICGYNKCYQAMDFHHIDPSTKEFNISGGTKAISKLKKEVDKCILVCSNCHREIHAGLINVETYKHFKELPQFTQ